MPSLYFSNVFFKNRMPLAHDEQEYIDRFANPFPAAVRGTNDQLNFLSYELL